jgi:hypothetical protein
VRMLRIYPRFFRAILAGKKTWEYREEGRQRFRVGETIRLVAVGEKSRKPLGKECFVQVTYIHREWPIPTGFVCMSIVPCACRAKEGA